MTPPRLLLQLPACLRRFVVGLLLVALPLHGLGGALLRMLGPEHRHEAAAEAPSWPGLVGGTLQSAVQSLVQSVVGPQTARLVENLRLQARLRPAASGHAHGSGAHHHHHDTLARHHHAPHDASVVATDGHGGGTDAATAGGTLMPLALPAALAIPTAPARLLRWPDRGETPWHSHVPALPERPPRA
ncbi:hypothetical protein [Pseudorhodoferax sp. Leaf274]|uniref:hypothetical protein n=1 Tax=Pseudorhodoferax sp. Leaf274 TaxID=1736318 RepID=UPI0012E17162|nr:hypothetical protein [Pseudorhodoferax sp. Leaf274]